MPNAQNDFRIDYIEFPVTHIANAKKFYGDAFGWKSEDYGPDYASFHAGRLAGGFRLEREIRQGGPLIVIYSSNLEALEAKIKTAGRPIIRPIFLTPNFPLPSRRLIRT
ncbi:MAG: VOC family protein [Candidatus Acidiferrales bacterium]